MIETKDQCGCCVGVVDGKILWFEGNMNEEVYRDGVLDFVWSKLQGVATRKGYYSMQDGASSHTNNENLQFLQSQFQDRVTSNMTADIWPPKSPDMNPLDFFLWGH